LENIKREKHKLIGKLKIKNKSNNYHYVVDNKTK